jgi:hypothetical protein
MKKNIRTIEKTKKIRTSENITLTNEYIILATENIVLAMKI